MLLWVMGVAFDNTCTVSGKWNTSRAIPRPYAWVYKTLRLSPLAVEHSVEVMAAGSQSRRSEIESYGSQFSIFVLSNLCLKSVVEENFEILVEVSDNSGPSSIIVRKEYLFAFQVWYCELFVENWWGETESIVWQFFAVLWCSFHRRWMRSCGMGQKV